MTTMETGTGVDIGASSTGARHAATAQKAAGRTGGEGTRAEMLHGRVRRASTEPITVTWHGRSLVGITALRTACAERSGWRCLDARTGARPGLETVEPPAIVDARVVVIGTPPDPWERALIDGLADEDRAPLIVAAWPPRGGSSRGAVEGGRSSAPIHHVRLATTLNDSCEVLVRVLSEHLDRKERIRDLLHWCACEGVHRDRIERRLARWTAERPR